MGNKGSVVYIVKVSKQLLTSLCSISGDCRPTQTAVEAITVKDCIVTHKAFHGLLEHHAKEDSEQSRCQDATVFGKWEGFREVTV